MTDANPAPTFYTVEDLCNLWQIGRSTLFKYIRKGCIPQPRRINARVIRWHAADIADVVRQGPQPVGTYADTSKKRSPRKSS